jgi:hypothetical protein
MLGLPIQYKIYCYLISSSLCWELWIKRVIDNKVYEVELPDYLEKSGLTPISHPWKLHLAPSDPYPGQELELQGPILLETADKMIMILERRMFLIESAHYLHRKLSAFYRQILS